MNLKTRDSFKNSNSTYNVITYTTLPAAINPATAATMARIVSRGLSAGVAFTGAGAGLAALVLAGAGRLPGAAGGAAAPALGALGAWAGAAVLNAGAGAPAAPGPLGPPGGRVGSLMVGAADGLGGKLIRTVSFFGWTLPVSFLGGTAPVGMLGMLSAITLVLGSS